MANIYQQPICSLQPQMHNTVIIGIIIGSQNSKIIDTTKTRYNIGSQAVWNFTLRDSINDFINVTVWGSVDYINKLFTTFNIGSIVEVINAKILERKENNSNEIYVPSVTSPFTLNLNQKSSLIQIHHSPDVSRYQMLLKIPTKNSTEISNLAYIIENSESLKNKFIDVIVVVTFISQVREIVTRLGELTKIREFEVGDVSTAQTVSLTLWDSKWITIADKWKPKYTILFLADAQIMYNEREKKSILTIARKTIITENPNISETKNIRILFQNKTEIASISPFAIPNPNSITKKMTIREITNKLNFEITRHCHDRLQLLVVVNAIVDNINLETDDLPLVNTKCAKCKRIILNGNDSCMNLECPFGSGIKRPLNFISLNILINLKDDTGYLIGCRLRDTVAEKAIGFSIDIQKEITKEQRLIIKQKYYKKLCNVRMQILGPSKAFDKPIYNIFELTKINYDGDKFEPLDISELNMSYG